MTSITNVKYWLILLMLAAVCLPGNAQSVPKLINYQGKLTDASGSPLVNGTYGIKIQIWSAASGGQLIWGQEYSSVAVVNGVFNLILGAGGTPVSGAAANDLSLAFTEPERYVGITVTKGSSGVAIPGATEIVPRQQILAAPYAVTASFATMAQNVVNGVPSGSIMPFAGLSAPAGWLLCNGAAVSRMTYSNLFAAIGTTYGNGDGSATFNLPDYRGRTLVGMDGSQVEFDSLGKVGGEKAHTLTISEMPSHNHSKQSWRGGYNGGGNWMWAWNAGNGDTGLQFTDNAGGGQSHNVLPPYRTVTYLIKN